MIPQGRLSSENVEGAFLTPEGRRFYALTNYERGPVAIEDTSEGLLYQDWTLTWNPTTGDITVTGETTGVSTVIGNLSDLVSITFTFDQNGRINYSYTTPTSSYLYWYDTALGMAVTTDLGADCITPSLYMDDKRSTQNTVNDMLLWYTKEEDPPGTYELFMLRQRDRFLTEYPMATGLEYPYLHNVGITNGLRIQLVLKPTVPNVPYAG